MSPPAPCPAHLTAPDLPLGVAGCPLPARPEGLGGSQQGEGSSFAPVAKQPPSPGPSSSSHPCRFWPPQTAFDLLIPLGLKQTKPPPPGTPVWGESCIFFNDIPTFAYPVPFPCCQLLTTVVTVLVCSSVYKWNVVEMTLPSPDSTTHVHGSRTSKGPSIKKNENNKKKKKKKEK